jgi:hypothetical protein
MSTPTSTPLTDAAEFDRDEDCSIPDDMVVTADFARDLERRLALAEQERDEARKALRVAVNETAQVLGFLQVRLKDGEQVQAWHDRTVEVLGILKQALQPQAAPGDNPETI